MLDPQLVDQCIHFPAFCVDGSQPSAREPAVETHIELVGDYHVYLSKRLVVASARLYGMLDADEALKLEQRATDAESKLALVEGELAELQPIADSIARATGRMEHAA